MKKISLIVLLIALVGLLTGCTEFYYKDKVKIVKGFYKGCTAIVIEKYNLHAYYLHIYSNGFNNLLYDTSDVLDGNNFELIKE